MKFRTLVLFLAATCARLLGFAPPAAAQSFEVAGIFNGDGGQPHGRLFEGPAGVIYGATYYGGRLARGSIFRLTVGPPAVFEELHAFFGPEGWGTGGLVLGPEGYLYAASGGGGLFGEGTIYRIDPSGRLTTVHDLAPDEYGVGDLCLASDGRLYGTTFSGGSAHIGTVFRLDPDGSTHALHEFTGPDGARPNGSLIQASDGMLYGTTSSSGAGFDPPSTFFRIDLDGNFESLHTFAVEDGYVTPVVQAPDGYLYGGSYNGGSHGAGMIFRVDLQGSFEKLHDIDPSLGEGVDVRSALLPAPDGNLWGVTYQGAGAGGTVFKISPSGEWTTVHSLSFAECANPDSPLLLGSDGRFYGTCQYGVPFSNELGSIFRIDTAGAFEILWSLRNTDGRRPSAGVVQGVDGNLYGTTNEGGAHQAGTLFRLLPSGQFEFLYDFASSGASPSPLTRASDGTIYGMTNADGDLGHGFIFRFSTGGVFSILHSFTATEDAGPSPLVEATDGNFYAPAPGGGADGVGAVLRMSVGGTVTAVHEFTTSEGTIPNNLIQSADGKLYFTATTPTNQYAIFSLGLDGMNLQTVAPFPVSAGPSPTGLTQATSGDFYGTAFFAASPSAGNVFHMDDTPTITSLHDFSGDDGLQPYGGVLQAADGNLYGTTNSGGPTTYGTVFRLTPGGGFTTIWNFHGTDGAHPMGPLSEGLDGALYGTAFSIDGTVFRWLTSPVSPTLDRLDPKSGPASGNTAVQIRGTHFQTAPAVSMGGAASPPAFGIDAQTVLAMSPPLSPGTLNDVILTNPDTASATLLQGWFADFTDMGSINAFHDDVESIVRAGITAGCGSGYYCGAAPVTRAQMAVFLLKAKHGSGFTPPACTGIFDDVACPGAFAVDWIEELSLEGITGGCGTATFCPDSPVRRDQMAVFLLKTSLGSDYVPPVASGTIFADVPASAFAADWIENLYALNVTGGCLTNPLRYCPGNTNNRQQMAVFLTKTFGLQ